MPAWGREGSGAQHSRSWEPGLARLSRRMPRVEKEEREGVGDFILAGEITEPQNHEGCERPHRVHLGLSSGISTKPCRP